MRNQEVCRASLRVGKDADYSTTGRETNLRTADGHSKTESGLNVIISLYVPLSREWSRCLS